MAEFTQPVMATLQVMFPSTLSVAAYPGSTYAEFNGMVMFTGPDSVIMGRTVSGMPCTVS